MMTPRDYLGKYHTLPVYVYTDEQAAASGTALPAGGRWVTVRLSQYRLQGGKNTKEANAARAQFWQRVKPLIDGKPPKGVKIKKGDAYSESITVWVMTTSGSIEAKTYHEKLELADNAIDAFYGKGSPEEVQVTLQLAVRYGLVEAEQLQEYCDSGVIGLDCNGFVGNYFRHVRLGIPWHSDPVGKAAKKSEIHASQGIKKIFEAGYKVQSLEDLTRYPASTFILAYCDKNGIVSDRYKKPNGETGYGHIMITNPGSLRLINWAVQPWYKITVLESTGGGIGLVESEYNILEVLDHGIFKVWRGSRSDTMLVKMSRIT